MGGGAKSNILTSLIPLHDEGVAYTRLAHITILIYRVSAAVA